MAILRSPALSILEESRRGIEFMAKNAEVIMYEGKTSDNCGFRLAMRLLNCSGIGDQINRAAIRLADIFLASRYWR